MRNIKKILFLLLLVISYSSYSQVNNQPELTADQILRMDIDKLSDDQIRLYWEKAQSQGYTLENLEVAARVKKIPEIQIMKLKRRIMQLPSKGNRRENVYGKVKNKDGQQGDELQQREETLDSMIVKKPIFGYDFFKNDKISFAPNLNMPTPENYTIGSGDELLVEIWGAAESSTSHIVDNQGNINVNMVGKIKVGGITFEQAKAKINSALKRIYAGISAPEGSYNKVYTGITLKEIRTIKVNIIGEVKVPGTYALNALSTVLNGLYACGGPNQNGSFRNIKVVRKGKQIAIYDIYDFLTKGSEQGNVYLKDQDVILVPPYQNHVEVIGAVKREGIYETRDGETMDDLSQYFGGFDPNAYKENIVVERINGTKREVKEVSLSNSNKFEIKSGDKIIVKKLSNLFHNRISIGGAVYQPGNYAFEQGVSVSDLIEKAGGITESAFLDRAIVFRKEKNDRKSLNFSVRDVLEKKSSIALVQNDSIHIYEKDGLDKKFQVSIEGAVKSPSKYDFMQGMRIEDLVLLAGGFTEGADPSTIQLGRQINDEGMKKTSQIFDVSLSPDLTVSANSVELEPNDIVTVRFKKGYTKQISVKIEGEVMYPGAYVLMSKEDKISDLLKRAGGFSPYAYANGATLVRKKTDLGEKEQEKQLKELKQIDGGIKEAVKEDKDSYRVGINIEAILDGKKGNYDLVLNDGDVVIIPSTRQTVEVKGQVLSPSMVRYDSQKNAKWYITHAGGFANDAKKKSVFVIYPNGSVKGTENFLFFRSYPKVEPGSVVVVPEKPQKPGMSATETVTITTAITTLAILIFNTFKK